MSGKRSGVSGEPLTAYRFLLARMWSIRSLAFLAVFCAAAAAASPPVPPIPQEAKRSGYDFLTPATRAMQDDELANPGALWVAEGESLWNTPAGPQHRSCADCHGAAASSMKGVAAHYPRYDSAVRRLLNLEQRIVLCRTEKQQAAPLAYESRELLALAAYVGHQSRGTPVNVEIGGPAQPHFERGRELYYRRLGQLSLSCAHCHDRNWGRKLRAETISQGHGSAYPAYRLEWQSLGSLHRRLRSCNAGVRAEPFDYGAQEYVDLELFLAWRAQGLPVETPGVRR